MKLNSVRALKSELAEKISSQFAESRILELPKPTTRKAAPFRPMVAQTLSPGRGTPKVRLSRDPKPAGRALFASTRPVAAFGVAPVSGRSNDFRLAARVFRGHEAQARALLEALKVPKKELDLATGVTYRPRLTLRPGGSCGHYQITAGTLGGFVRDDEGTYILSNNHVLANSDDAWVGDPILQPGPADIRSRYSIIGHLERWLPLRSRRTDGFDAALAKVVDEVTRVTTRTYQGIGRVIPNPIANRYAVTKVAKRGRTTQVTQGRVSAYELDGVTVNYGTDAQPLLVTFNDQIEFVGEPPERPFSQPGDSGSFIIDTDTMKPYALLYGGGPDSEGIDRTLGQLMTDVLGALGVALF